MKFFLQMKDYSKAEKVLALISPLLIIVGVVVSFKSLMYGFIICIISAFLSFILFRLRMTKLNV